MYKVGQKVFIKTHMIPFKIYQEVMFIDAMAKYKGKTTKIRHLEYDHYILEDCNGWVWSKSMLMPIYDDDEAINNALFNDEITYEEYEEYEKYEEAKNTLFEVV